MSDYVSTSNSNFIKRIDKRLLDHYNPHIHVKWAKGFYIKEKQVKQRVFHPYLRLDWKFDFDQKPKYPVLCKL